MSYDNIDTPLLTCPNPDCKKRLTGFRSNNGPCEDKQLPFYLVNSFYTSCECGTEVTYNRKFFQEVPITDFQINYDLPPPPKEVRKGFTLGDEEDESDEEGDCDSSEGCEGCSGCGNEEDDFELTVQREQDALDAELKIDHHLIETFHPIDEDDFEDDAGFQDVNSQVCVED